MDLSIVIVNWNSLDFTLQCIRSLYASVNSLDYEIIVVDNASQDDCCNALTGMHPSVKCVQSPRNIGFARANNLGAGHSTGRNLLFLNPDTLVRGDAIERMAARLDSADDAGAVGCRLLNSDLTLQMSCVQAFPSIANQLLDFNCLKTCCPTLPLWGMQALFSDGSKPLHDVDVVSGACLMTKRHVFEAVHGFSTDYFMYAEETDLCYKIRSAGWRVCHVGDAQIVHFGGESSKKKARTFAAVMMRESIFKLLRKFRGTTYARLYCLAILLGAVTRLALVTPLLAVPGRFFDRDAASRVAMKWYSITRWALGLEGWVRGSEYQSPGNSAAAIGKPDA